MILIYRLITLYSALVRHYIVDTSLYMCDGISWMYGRNRVVRACMMWYVVTCISAGRQIIV